MHRRCKNRERKKRNVTVENLIDRLAGFDGITIVMCQEIYIGIELMYAWMES